MADETNEFYKEPTRKEWVGFWTLVAVQAQNAFNEKAVQFLLIPLGVWLWGAADSTLEYMLGAIFVLPYILFSPLVGWLADCFCKTRIIQVMSILQFIVMACMLFCFYQHDMHAAIIWFAVFATQATILSPAKKGIVKDLLGSRYIGFGSGIIEMSMVFVLLLAQIGVFFWFSYLLGEYSELPDGEQEAGWSSVILPTWVFLGLAALVSAAAFLLPRYPAKKANPFRWSLFYEHFVQIKYLWKDRLLRISELGISFFWCLAGSLFLILIQIAKGMQAQNPVANAVKGADPHALDVKVHHRLKARAHLAGGLIGKRNGKNLRGPGKLLRQKPGNARGQNLGFARACAGQNERIDAAELHGLPLHGIERIEIFRIHRFFSNVADIGKVGCAPKNESRF